MKHKFVTIIFLHLLLISLVGCESRTVKPDKYIGSFDLSSDDRKIVFAYVKKNQSSIYEINTNGKGLKELFPLQDSVEYFKPKYSRTGRLLFIERKRSKNGEYSICVSNADGSDVKTVLTTHKIITEAFFSEWENKIYYCKGNEYGHSSPLGTDQVHDVDVYSLDLNTGQIQQVTKLRAYSISRISEFDKDHILMYMPVQEKGGMLILSKDNSDSVIRINPANNPKGRLDLYYTPVHSSKYNSLVFIATYELMVMDMKDRIAKVVVNNAGKAQFKYFVLYHSNKKIIYTRDDEMKFHIVNYDGKNASFITIP